jgi:hypothetical protein
MTKTPISGLGLGLKSGALHAYRMERLFHTRLKSIGISGRLANACSFGRDLRPIPIHDHARVIYGNSSRKKKPYLHFYWAQWGAGAQSPENVDGCHRIRIMRHGTGMEGQFER